MRLHLLALLLVSVLLANLQTVKAQKVVLHMTGNQTFECNISQLDSIKFTTQKVSIHLPNKQLAEYSTLQLDSITFIEGDSSENDDTTDPSVTGDAIDITNKSATLIGYATSIRDNLANDLRIGFIYCLEGTPGKNNGTQVEVPVKEVTEDGQYFATLTNLLSNTIYYFRSFIYQSGLWFYGKVKSFMTNSVEGDLNTGDATAITCFSAKVSGSVNIQSSYLTHEYGICYGTRIEPTINNNKLTATSENFTLQLRQLYGETVYYYRTYAIIDGQAYYGTVRTFRTLDDNVVETGTIDEKTLTVTSHITIGGGAYSSLVLGVCYGKTETPTVNDKTVTSDEVDDENNYTVTFVSPGYGTIYYRAYVLIDGIPHYGNVKSFERISFEGILKSLQNIAERYVILNECRGDLVDASGYVSDTIAAIVNFDTESEKLKDGASAYLRISDYYHIINSCNAYIAMCDTMRTTGTNQKYMLKEYSQVQSIRAWVYMQLLYTYGENKLPFYTEPMLTTDDINNFVADENHPKLSARLLADVLGPKLEEMEPIEVNLGLPQFEGLPNYNNYGDQSSGSSHFVCHSTKCMFPVSIVLGDLYLLSARSRDEYAKAATHYYNYINTRNCGPLGVDKCFSRGLLNDRLDYPVYNNYYTSTNTNSSAYNETSAVSQTSEAITCIPSNKGKLEGKVLTDISRLFGFEAQLRTSNDESASASVSLSREYERELIPSKGYETLCDAQDYEIYVGTTTNSIFNYESLEVLPGVGDARRAWIYNKDGAQWNFQVGDDLLTGKMVSKQNPGGQFTTTYPVIYRKSTVWLRYAEALNRAGFPSYAFAILKTGLCNNPEWFPVDPLKLYASNGSVSLASIMFPYFGSNGEVNAYTGLDYMVTDSLFLYTHPTLTPEGEKTYISLPKEGEEPCTTYAALEEYMINYFQAEYNEYQARYEASLGTEQELEPMEAPNTIDKSMVYWQIPSLDAVSNQPSDYCTAACYYIGRNELERAATAPFLDFKQPYLRGQSQSQLIYYKEQGQLLNEKVSNGRIPSSTSVDYTYTIGVHQRGCGFIRYDDPIEFRSRYNYVAMVQQKIKEATGADVTAEQIYSGEIDELVKNAVEDLIIDECALELAFEGSRFSDLCRVAMRRGDANYLAERVSKRHTGEVDENLRSKLSDMNKWFLPVSGK